MTSEKIKTKGLCHIAIDVSDLQKSEKFYTDIFDMTIVSRNDRFIHLHTTGAQDSLFLFRADGKVSLKSCGLSRFHFGFRIDDDNFDRAMIYIKKNNIKVHQNRERPPGRYVYIEDPDGYVVQLEPGDCGG
ncbi:MAG TPA: VOC family protein [Methanocella sp.]|nr:VOC family protein [Methanocella sp.]